jgi:hypothetical protein
MSLREETTPRIALDELLIHRMPTDYAAARAILDGAFDQVLGDFLAGNSPPSLSASVRTNVDRMFQSATQAYREAVLGCLLMKIQDHDVNVRKPYINQGKGAYNGRTMDERVVNPFLHDNRIPSSRGPFLSVFRRSVPFDETTRGGLRDKAGYDAMLGCVAFIETASKANLMAMLSNMLYSFIRLREAAQVPLSRLQRFSLMQYSALIRRLLNAASGGRFPVFLVVSALEAINVRFQLRWEIEFQGINVADRAAGAGGDITVRAGDVVLLAAEVTERTVGRDRVVSTFNTKIAPAGIDDYLFFVNEQPGARVLQQCQQYFAQGHEVSFLDIATWLDMILGTIGRRGRETFNQHLLDLLDDRGTPQAVRVAWNEAVAAVVEVT